MQTKAFAYLMIGLFTTLVFSRLYGTSNIWRAIVLPENIGLLKNVIQESLELLGYLLILQSALLSYLKPKQE